MTTIGAYEAKTHFAQLLAEAAAGEVVTITKHGREVAKLVPVGPSVGKVDDVIADLLAARKSVRRGRVTVRRMIDEGRR